MQCIVGKAMMIIDKQALRLFLSRWIVSSWKIFWSNFSQNKCKCFQNLSINEVFWRKKLLWVDGLNLVLIIMWSFSSTHLHSNMHTFSYTSLFGGHCRQTYIFHTLISEIHSTWPWLIYLITKYYWYCGIHRPGDPSPYIELPMKSLGLIATIGTFIDKGHH